MRSCNKGFTLIELMIGVVIIGILTAIAVPNFAAMQDFGREAVVKQNAHVLRLAVEDWAVEHDGQYPSGPEAEALVDSLVEFGHFNKNPYGGEDFAVKVDNAMLGDLSGPSSAARTMEGMVTYTTPQQVAESDSSFVTHWGHTDDLVLPNRQYIVDAFGKYGTLVLTLSNG